MNFNKKYFVCVGIVILGLCSYITSCFSQNVRLDNYVTDHAGVLTVQELGILNQQAQQYAQLSGHEIATLIIPNRNGRELYDITLEAFRNNGIGKKDANNGVLLVIVTEEKKLRIMVGYGLEGALPDVYLKQLLETDLRPLLDSGSIFKLVNTYHMRIEETLAQERYTTQGQQNGGGEFVFGFIVGYRLLTLLAVFYPNISRIIGDHSRVYGVLFFIGLVISVIVGGWVLWYIGFSIGSLLGGLYRGTDVRRSYNDIIFRSGGYYGGGGGFDSGFGGFGGFGGGSSGGGSAGD